MKIKSIYYFVLAMFFVYAVFPALFGASKAFALSNDPNQQFEPTPGAGGSVTANWALTYSSGTYHLTVNNAVTDTLDSNTNQSAQLNSTADCTTCSVTLTYSDPSTATGGTQQYILMDVDTLTIGRQFELVVTDTTGAAVTSGSEDLLYNCSTGGIQAGTTKAGTWATVFVNTSGLQAVATVSLIIIAPQAQEMNTDLVYVANLQGASNLPCLIPPTATFTPTSTLTNSPTVTFTVTDTGTPTSTFTPTGTPTPSSTSTATGTPTFTNTYTATFTSTFSSTLTFTSTPTISSTSTPSSTQTDSPSATFTSTTTATPTATLTSTESSTPTNSATNSPTGTPTFTLTVTPTSTESSTPTNSVTSSPTVTPTFTLTSTGTPLATSTDTVTSTSTATVTSTSTSTRTSTPLPTSTTTFTTTPSNSPTSTFTFTHTFTPTITATATSTITPTITNTPGPTSTYTQTPCPIVVYPNPMDFQHVPAYSNNCPSGSACIKFDCVPVGSTLKIYTVSLGLVRNFTANEPPPIFTLDSGLNVGTFHWDGNNGDGNPVSSGFYLYVVEGPGGRTFGKFAISRSWNGP